MNSQWNIAAGMPVGEAATTDPVLHGLLGYHAGACSILSMFV